MTYEYPVGKFDRVRVCRDYVNLHGVLVAQVGAEGVIRSNDRGIYGVDFPITDERVILDACNRRCHAIPAYYIETIYDETNSVLFQNKG